jgi:hypothetical protein
MALHDLAQAGEADAGTGELAGRVQPLERGEQLVDEGRVETGAVVAHVIAHRVLPDRHRRELNHRAVPAGAVFPGVVQQVLQDRTNQSGVRLCPDRLLDDEADVAVRSAALEFLGDVVDRGAQIDRLEVHLGLRDARKVKQGVDEPRHLRARGLDSLGVAPAVLAETVPALF